MSARKPTAGAGLPAFGLALASTVVSTYLPVLIERRRPTRAVAAAALRRRGRRASRAHAGAGGGAHQASRRAGRIKTFVVLFFTVGLGRSLGFTSIVLATVAGAALVAAPLSGWASDRFGDRSVIEIAAWVFGIGLLTPLVTVSPWAFPLVFLTAFAAVVLITPPYSLVAGEASPA